MVRRKFNDSLLKAIDFAFGSLGESSKQSLYFHLEKSFHIGRMKIPEKVKEFDVAIKSIFKDGAVFLERLILGKLCEDLGVEFDRNSCFDFGETVSRVKNMVLERESLLMVSSFDDELAVAKRKGRGEQIESDV